MKFNRSNYLTQKIDIFRWQFNLVVFTSFVLGIFFTFGYLLNKIWLSKTWATSSPWSQTDWSGGQGASTTNQYSAISNIETTSGQFSLSNAGEEFINTDFESDLSSWSSPTQPTGGTLSTSGNYRIHTFKANETFTAVSSDNLEVLVVAGGGGGAAMTGGGGGAGGLIYNASYPVTSQSYAVTIGNGGSGGVGNNDGSNGQNSTFASLIAIGGGGGGMNSGIGKSGGSGGGAGHNNTTGGAGTTGQGNNGRGANTSAPNYGAGGGGGAGAMGSVPTNTAGGNGGDGLAYSISGSSVYYAGGGGGGTYMGGTLGLGGLGGGGNAPAGNATPNTGGGGGGQINNQANGGNGGSGIVIVRYLTSSATQDLDTKYAGAASAKLISGSSGQNFTQSVNVGDTNVYLLSAYVYIDGTTVVDDSYAQLFYNGATIATAYTDASNGWYKLTGTITGANASRDFGIQVKPGKTVYADNFSLSRFSTSGTLTSAIFDTGFASDWGVLSFTSTGSGTVSVKVRSSNSATMEGATDWATCIAKTSGSDLSGGCVTDTQRYIQCHITLEPSGYATPIITDISINFTASDQIAPAVNATNATVVGLGTTAWTKTLPTIGWTGGEDNNGGAGIMGYCLSLDGVGVGFSAPDNDPVSSSGILPPNQVNPACPFILTNNQTQINLANSAIVGTGFTLASDTNYYLSIKAIDLAGNVFVGSQSEFQNLTSFSYDITPPVNVKYISTPSNNFSNVTDMSFSWPTTGSSQSSDVGSGLLGWQYQLDATTSSWQGTVLDNNLNIYYIPVSDSSYSLTQTRDGGFFTTSGTHTVYFRAVDKVGNFSSEASVRTGALNYGGAAPSFSSSCIDSAGVSLTPTSSITNLFGLSWPQAVASGSNSIAQYYYMVNANPPTSLATLQGNVSTYIPNGDSTVVLPKSLPNVNKGNNTVYVVAIDNAATPNYSSSNCIKGVFTLDSTDPDNVGNILASDSSIKSSSQWNVTLTWTAPEYKGAGNLTYLVYRSTDNVTFGVVGSTGGLSYVDNTPSSAKYYYKIYTKDGAQAQSSGTNVISITPTGKWTTPPDLESGPDSGSVTTKRATITWSTSRTSDSKIQFSATSGNYGSVEPSNSAQTTFHSIQLEGLSPSTTYYYKAKWTDEDGNTGTSVEKSFTTDPSPTVTDPKAKNISISSAILEFTSKGASKVKVYYGKSPAFGALKEIVTGTSEGLHTTELVGLDDGTKYFYKINTFDTESGEYEGNVLTFETLPRPRLTNVRLQEVRGTAQPTVLVTWTSNTPVSSIITYFPQARPEDARDEINVVLTQGEHKLVLRGLSAQTQYVLVVKGRDKVGNEAQSDRQQFTTATDTRPPSVIDLKVQGSTESVTGSQEEQTQLVVSWNTDEPSTSQVEYGEGSGATYSQKTQQDTNLTVNHLVIISGLSPSKVYHLRALSLDGLGNQGNSIDTVTITPKASDNALNLVVSNLQQAFGFLGGLKK